MIAGGIIPSIVTTAAMTAGAIGIEIYKLHMHTNLEVFKNTVINLGTNIIVMSEPEPPVKTISKDFDIIFSGPVKAYPEGFSTWDKLIVDGPCTLADFIKKILEIHKLKVQIVFCGRTFLYNEFTLKNTHNDKLGKLLQELYQEGSETTIIPGRRYLAIEILCEGLENNVDYLVPVIKYTF